MPRVTSAAASFQPMCSSIIAPESSTAPGLAMFLPVYFGTVPCVASNMAARSPTFAPVACVGHDVGVAPLPEEVDELFGALGVAPELDPAIHVLGVLAEDHQVDLVGALVGRLDALEVAHGADAGVQVEADAQKHVDAAE